MQPQLVRDLGRVHGVRQVLLVGEDEEDGLTQLVLSEHSVELVPGLGYPLSVVAVHHEDESLSVLEVMSPQRSDLVLTAHVPHCEADVLVLHSLHVEPDGGDGGHDLAQLQLVEDCCLTGSVQPWGEREEETL